MPPAGASGAPVGERIATLFGPGDVLRIDAMLGVLLVFPLRFARPRTIVLLIVLCAWFPVVSGMLRLMVIAPDITAMPGARQQAMEAADSAAPGSGSFLDAARQHALTMSWMWVALGAGLACGAAPAAANGGPAFRRPSRSPTAARGCAGP